MVKITGADKHSKRLKRMASAENAQAIAAALYAGGQRIEIDAEISITTGSVSGKNHVPSAPGQPPNADTRTLDTNIETRIVPSRNPRVNVESLAPYSAALEFGTSRMAERPFMRPAAERNRRKISEDVRAAANRVNRKPV